MHKPTRFVVVVVGGIQIYQVLDKPGDVNQELGPEVAFQTTAPSSAPGDTGATRMVAEAYLDRWVDARVQAAVDIVGVTVRPAILDTGSVRDTG